MRKKFIIYLVLFNLLIFASSLFAMQISSITSSSTEDNNYLPECSIDNDFKTRWSSAFTDNEWLSIGLDKDYEIGGLTLYWEAAFSKKYNVYLSDDNESWRFVYEEKFGDGNTDEIFFKPQSAKFIKIEFLKRGTDWGNSLFEIKVHEKLFAPHVDSETCASCEFAVDGLYSSGAVFGAAEKASIVFSFNFPMDISGIELFWQDESPEGFSYDVRISEDNINWAIVSDSKNNKRFQSNKTDLIRDLVSFGPRMVKYIKVEVNSLSGSTGLSEMRIKHYDDIAGSPLMAYRKAAKKARRGLYPLWLLQEQEYWTILGSLGTKKEIAVSEFGRIENGFSLEPVLKINDSVKTWNDFHVEQNLENDWMPIANVVWEGNDIVLEEKIFCFDYAGANTGAARFKIKNISEKEIKGNLYLVLRPLKIHPEWLYGGIASIYDVAYKKNKILLNDKQALLLPEIPDGGACLHSFQEKDVIESIVAGKAFDNEAQYKSDVSCLMSGALAYNFVLNPGEEKEVFIVFADENFKEDISNAKQWLAKKLSDIKNEWQKQVAHFEINLPEKIFSDVLKSQIAYGLIHYDEAYFQPGSRVYENTWMRDGAVSVAAFLRMGFTGFVRNYIDWISLQQHENGFIPFRMQGEIMPSYLDTWKEYDSQGEYIYAVAEYYRFTRDRDFLKNKINNIERAVNFLVSVLDKKNNGDGLSVAFNGVLKESNSHEGYFPAQHSNWDNYWALRGLRDAVFCARELSDSRFKEWCLIEKKFCASLIESLSKTIHFHDIDYLPGCIEKGDFDPPAIAIAYFPCNIDSVLPQKELMNSFDKYFIENFLPKKTGDFCGAYSAYELRIAFAFLMRGEKEKALEIIRYFFTQMYPAGWREWGETIFTNIREPQYLGDLPHGWVSMIYVNLIRSMLVYEKDGALVLNSGVPDEWFFQGFSYKDLPTWYGTISCEVICDKTGKIRIKIDGNAVPSHGFTMFLPSGKKADFSSLPHTVDLSG